MVSPLGDRHPLIETHTGDGRGARILARVLRLLLYPLVARLPMTPERLRHAWVIDRLAVCLRPPRGTRTARASRTRAAGREQGLDCEAEWVRGRGVPVSKDRVVLYFHGGGFVACGLRTHRRLVARISAAAGCPALSVAYRMPPRVPIATSVNDCVAGYRWLLRRGFSPGGVVIAGDSAGGYLSLMTAIRARDEGLPRPAGVVALSPFTDLDLAAKLASGNDRDYLPAARLADVVGLCWPGIECDDPEWSPARADLAGLPPVLIQTGGRDLLRPDAELMARRLAAAGVLTRLQIWQGHGHVYQMFADIARDALAAIDEVGGFCRRVTAGGPTPNDLPNPGPDAKTGPQTRTNLTALNGWEDCWG